MAQTPRTALFALIPTALEKHLSYISVHLPSHTELLDSSGLDWVAFRLMWFCSILRTLYTPPGGFQIQHFARLILLTSFFFLMFLPWFPRVGFNCLFLIYTRCFDQILYAVDASEPAWQLDAASLKNRLDVYSQQRSGAFEMSGFAPGRTASIAFIA